MANLSNINNKFIVTDGGNVLIGQSNNSSGRLQIKDTQTSSFNDGLAITRNNAAQTGYINMVGGAFNFNSPGLSYKFRNNGTQTLELDSSGKIQVGSDKVIWAGGYGGGLVIRQNNATGDRLIKMVTVDSAGAIANDNVLVAKGASVGIGTASPGSKLEVVGGTSTFSYSDATPAGSASSVYRDAVFGSTDTTNTGITVFGSGQTGISFGDAGSNIRGQVRYQHATDTLELGASGNINMYINSTGDVGIGVTDPKNKLNIFSGTDTMMGFWGSSTYSAMQSVNLANTVLKDMRFDFNKAFFVGNAVGIGTVLPNKRLTVYGGNDNGIWIDSQGGQYTSLAFGHNGTEKANIAWDNTNGITNISTYASGHLAMSTGGGIKAFLNSSGNFGIGDTAPTSISINTSSLSVNSSRTDLSGGLISKSNGTVKHQQYWDSSGYGFNITANSGVFKFNGADVQVNANIKANDVNGKIFSNVASWAYVTFKNDLFSFGGTEGALWEYTIKMNPNSGGSGAYRDFYYGKLGIGIGWNGSALTQFLWQQQDQTLPRSLYGSGGGNFSILFRMYYSGGVYTELAYGTAWTLRIQGLSTSTYGDIFFRRLA